MFRIPSWYLRKWVQMTVNYIGNQIRRHNKWFGYNMEISGCANMSGTKNNENSTKSRGLASRNAWNLALRELETSQNLSKRVLRYQLCIGIVFAWVWAWFHCSTGPNVSQDSVGFNPTLRKSKTKQNSWKMDSNDRGLYHKQIRSHNKWFGYARDTQTAPEQKLNENWSKKIMLRVP